MSKPTTTVKDRWNAKAYDTITLRVPKGEKEKLKKLADKAGLSLNAYMYQKAVKDQP